MRERQSGRHGHCKEGGGQGAQFMGQTNPYANARAGVGRITAIAAMGLCSKCGADGSLYYEPIQQQEVMVK